MSSIPCFGPSVTEARCRAALDVRVADRARPLPVLATIDRFDASRKELAA